MAYFVCFPPPSHPPPHWKEKYVNWIKADYLLVRDPSMVELRCMSFLGKDSGMILVAGCQSVMYKVDVLSGQIVQQVSSKI